MNYSAETDTHITAPDVRRRYGITEPALKSWLADPSLGFPRPLLVRGRQYFSWAELIAWEASRRAPAPKAQEDA